MKKNVHRLWALLLSCLMIVGIFAGCAKQPDAPETTAGQTNPSVNDGTAGPAPSDDPYHITDEHVEYRIAAGVISMWGDLNDKQVQLDLEEKTNVDIKWETYPMEVGAERAGILMASSPRPDAFWNHNNFTRAQALEYGRQGLLIDLKPLIKQYAPNIDKCYTENDLWRLYEDEEGHMYSLTSVSVNDQTEYVDNEIIINVDLLKSRGGKMPETTDEFFDALMAIKGAKTPDGKEIIPLTWGPMYNYGTVIKGAFGIVDQTWSPNVGGGLYIGYEGKGGDVYSQADTQEYKDFVKYMNKLYTNDLIDKEVYTHDDSVFNAKVASGQAACFVDFGGYAIGFPKLDSGEYWGVPCLKGPSGEALTQNMAPKNIARDACDFCITVDCKDPVTLIKYVDLHYNQDLMTPYEVVNGPENVNWFFNEDGLIEKMPRPPEFDTNGKFRCAEIVPAGPSYNGPKITSRLYKDPSQRYYREEIDEGCGYWAAAARDNPLPLLTFNEEENEELSILRTDLIDYLKTFEAACITGQKDIDKEWDTHLKQLKTLQMDRVIEIYNNAVDRIDAAGK